MQYNYFRYYDPSTGRYLTSDPIGLRGGLNTFAYVYSRPTSLYDPNGLEVRGEWTVTPHVRNIEVFRPDVQWTGTAQR